MKININPKTLHRGGIFCESYVRTNTSLLLDCNVSLYGHDYTNANIHITYLNRYIHSIIASIEVWKVN